MDDKLELLPLFEDEIPAGAEDEALLERSSDVPLAALSLAAVRRDVTLLPVTLLAGTLIAVTLDCEALLEDSCAGVTEGLEELTPHFCMTLQSKGRQCTLQAATPSLLQEGELETCASAQEQLLQRSTVNDSASSLQLTSPPVQLEARAVRADLHAPKRHFSAITVSSKVLQANVAVNSDWLQRSTATVAVLLATVVTLWRETFPAWPLAFVVPFSAFVPVVLVSFARLKLKSAWANIGTRIKHFNQIMAIAFCGKHTTQCP